MSRCYSKLQEQVEQSKLWKTDPEQAKRLFKDSIRESKDPRGYLSCFFEDIIDEDDIAYIKDWQSKHQL